MKTINNYKEFLDELEKGNKNIYVTDEFYDWLKHNVEVSYPNKEFMEVPITPFNSIRVYREEKENDKKV